MSTKPSETRQQETRIRPGGGGGGHGPMGMMVQKPKDFKKTLKRVFSYISSDLPGLLGISFISMIAVLFGIIGPYYLGQITNRFQFLIEEGLTLRPEDITFITNIVLVLLVLYLISFVVRFIEQYLMAGFGQGIVHRMRLVVNAKLDKLPLSYFDRHVHGEIMSRVTNDIDTFANSLQQTFTSVISGMITIIGVMAFMIYLSWQLTLVSLIMVPLSIVLTKNIFKVAQQNFRAQSKQVGQLNGHIEETFGNHAIVKAFSQEKSEYEAFKTHNQSLAKINQNANFFSALIFPIMGFVNNVGYVAVTFVGGILALQGIILIGSIQAFIMYLRTFTQQINQITQITNIVQSGIAAAERVFEVLDEPEEIADVTSSVDASTLKAQVELEHVKFSYTDDRPLINDLSLVAEEGHMVAIVGPTGAGKTTLVNLLLRFYEIKGGSIRIDGVDIGTLSRADLRRQFGMVLQDTWLFHGTIEENIRYGNTEATFDDIISAAQAAHADTFIRSLPGGYQYMIDEDSNNLSAGEKQLLTIARALLANPKILILDEATSSVDTRLEMLIQNGMNELMKNRTSFVIAHRLSTIKNADHILVMQHGDIVESGNHEQLLAQQGVYASLYQSQFEGQSI